RVLQDNPRAYSKGPPAARVRALFGDSLTVVDGERWRQRRRQAQPAFQPGQHARFIAVTTRATAEMLDRWRLPTERGEPVELMGEMRRLTQTIIIRALFGEVTGRLPGADDLPGLGYTRRVIDEVLRLYPPTWLTARTASENDELGGYEIPAGALILLSPYVTHRHLACWEEPERFDPDRFMPTRAAARPAFAYFPFGGGPRRCIGGAVATTELQRPAV